MNKLKKCYLSLYLFCLILATPSPRFYNTVANTVINRRVDAFFRKKPINVLAAPSHRFPLVPQNTKTGKEKLERKGIG